MTEGNFKFLLAAPGRSPEIPESADAYGWLIGSWELDVRHYSAVDVAGLHIQGEAHFSWVLEGRAVQDVWIMPRCSERTADLGKTGNMYGTTLRVWDPSIQAWHITWINPVAGHREEQIGRWSGKDVVQVGARSNGVPTRWKVHRNHAGFLSLDRRIAESGWRNLETRRRVPRQTDGIMVMRNDKSLREHLLYLIQGDGAHVDFEAAVKDLPVSFRGKRPKGAAHSPWEVLEHLRITQWDILEFTRNANHTSPEFPDGYWPGTQAPPNEEDWDKSADAFRADFKAITGLVANESTDLFAQFPHGDGQTVLRKVLLVADHNAYHLGELVLLRRLLGAWK